MILHEGNPVECVARLALLTGIAPGLSAQIDVKVDKKKTILTQEASLDNSRSYQKRGATIAALE